MPLLIPFPLPGIPSLSPYLHSCHSLMSSSSLSNSPSVRLPTCVSTQDVLDCRALMPGSLPLLDLSPLRSGSSSDPSKYSTCYTALHKTGHWKMLAKPINVFAPRRPEWSANGNQMSLHPYLKPTELPATLAFLLQEQNTKQDRFPLRAFALAVHGFLSIQLFPG